MSTKPNKNDSQQYGNVWDLNEASYTIYIDSVLATEFGAAGNLSLDITEPTAGQNTCRITLSDNTSGRDTDQCIPLQSSLNDEVVEYYKWKVVTDGDPTKKAESNDLSFSTLNTNDEKDFLIFLEVNGGPKGVVFIRTTSK